MTDFIRESTNNMIPSGMAAWHGGPRAPDDASDPVVILTRGGSFACMAKRAVHWCYGTYIHEIGEPMSPECDVVAYTTTPSSGHAITEGERKPLGFRAWLAFSIAAARFNPDALDPKAAGILDDVLARYDAAAPSSEPAIAEGEPIPEGVWWGGAAFHTADGKTLAPWGIFGRKWGSRRSEFPQGLGSTPPTTNDAIPAGAVGRVAACLYGHLHLHTAFNSQARRVLSWPELPENDYYRRLCMTTAEAICHALSAAPSAPATGKAAGEKA